MIKTNKIYMMAQYKDNSWEQWISLILDWLKFIRIVGAPQTIVFNEEPSEFFKIEEVEKRVYSFSTTEKMWIKIDSNIGEFQLFLNNLSIREHNLMDFDSYSANKNMIEDYFDQRLVEAGIYGYIRSFDEYLYNNVETLEKRTFENESEQRKLAKYLIKDGGVAVDCNQLNGYDMYCESLCFTSCWKMYYSRVYYQIIPKIIFLELQQVQEITELPNDCIKISLFEDPLAWDLTVNEKYQYFFRDQIGFDQFNWENGTGVLRPVFIEYLFTETSIQTVQYQNDYFQPTEKNQATHFVTRSYNLNNQTYVEERTKGTLDLPAYFPWIDEMNSHMMTYRIINPYQTTDNGVTAYEFYIRELLEINVLNSKYQKFILTLTFYIPEEAISNVPFKFLESKMVDVNFANLNHQKQLCTFQAIKGNNHLQIIFLADNQLKINEKVSGIKHLK